LKELVLGSNMAIMVTRRQRLGSFTWVLSALVAGTVSGCGESSDDDGESSTGGSSTGGSSTGGSTNTGGAAGSGATGGSAGSTSGGSGGSGGTDPCGGCGPNMMCIYQVGGPGPGRVLCASNPICRAASECDCIAGQGDCMPAPAGGDYDVECQCDNGLE
jgi:hypothetical protein